MNTLEQKMLSAVHVPYPQTVTETSRKCAALATDFACAFNIWIGQLPAAYKEGKNVFQLAGLYHEHLDQTNHE